MGVLSVGAHGVIPRFFRTILFTVGLFNIVQGFFLSRFGNTHRVGTHISDETDIGTVDGDAFIKLLSQLHGALGRVIQFLVGLLLHTAGGKGRQRRLFAVFLLHRSQSVRSTLEIRKDLFHPLLIGDLRLFAVDLQQFSGEFAVIVEEIRFQRPVFFGDESVDLILAFADEADGHTLYAAGGKPFADFFPEQRADFIPHKTV